MTAVYDRRGYLDLGCYITVSLTPRFSEVHNRIYYRNRFSGLLAQWQKTAEAVGLPQAPLPPS